MSAVDAEVLGLEVTLARDVVRLVSKTALRPLRFNAVSITETGCLVHVEPDTVDL